jgi:hypothetical protein
LKCQNLDQMSSQKIRTSQHWSKPQALISGARIASQCLIRLFVDMQLIKSRGAKTHFSGQKLKPCISTYDFVTYMPNKCILLLLDKTMHFVQCWPINSFTVNSALKWCSHSICIRCLSQTTPVPWKCSYLSYFWGFLYHCFLEATNKHWDNNQCNYEKLQTQCWHADKKTQSIIFYQMPSHTRDMNIML